MKIRRAPRPLRTEAGSWFSAPAQKVLHVHAARARSCRTHRVPTGAKRAAALAGGSSPDPPGLHRSLPPSCLPPASLLLLLSRTWSGAPAGEVDEDGAGGRQEGGGRERRMRCGKRARSPAMSQRDAESLCPQAIGAKGPPGSREWGALAPDQQSEQCVISSRRENRMHPVVPALFLLAGGCSCLGSRTFRLYAARAPVRRLRATLFCRSW